MNIHDHEIKPVIIRTSGLHRERVPAPPDVAFYPVVNKITDALIARPLGAAILCHSSGVASPTSTQVRIFDTWTALTARPSKPLCSVTVHKHVLSTQGLLVETADVASGLYWSFWRSLVRDHGLDPTLPLADDYNEKAAAALVELHDSFDALWNHPCWFVQ